MLAYVMMIETLADQSKFEKIYHTYKGLMFHVAYQILHNEEDAEDAVHNAFVKIAEHISKIDLPVCPKTKVYVVTIVENKAIDLYRQNKRRSREIPLDDIVVPYVKNQELQGLAACMEHLPVRYRQVILLKYQQGLSNQEIAKHLDISEANAIKLDQRAKKKLLEICKKEGIL